MCLFRNRTDKIKEDHVCSCEKCSCNEDPHKINNLDDSETNTDPKKDVHLCGGCCKS